MPPTPISTLFPWRQRYEPGVPHTVDGNTPLLALLHGAATRTPDAPAITAATGSWSYSQLKESTDGLARALWASGCRPGDVVISLVDGHSATASATFWACVALGLVCAPLAWGEDDATIERIRERTGARAVVTREPRPGMRGHVLTWPQQASHPPLPEPPPAPHPDTPVLLTHTSGTTGDAKGVLLTQRNLRCSVDSCRAWMNGSWERLGITEHTVLGVIPTHHIFGALTGLLLPVALGGHVHQLRSHDPADLADTFLHVRPTLMALLPSQYEAIAHHLLRHDAAPTDCRAVCVTGAVALPQTVQDTWHDATGCHLYNWYGMSESASLGTFQPLHLPPTPGDVGVPQPGCDVEVIDPDGRPVATGTVGRLRMRGPHVFAGYHGDDERTSATLVDGWLLTEDLGSIDADGTVRLAGRMNDILNVDGNTVLPGQVEDVLTQLGDVVEAAVYPRRHGAGGDLVMAAVTLVPGSACTPADIVEHARRHLPAFMVPVKVSVVPAMPRGRSGKLLRRQLPDVVKAARKRA